jgi:O-antigen/teichoic acid export membrane protein
MTQVRRNILANYVGGAWSALMGFAFIPLYIKYLGIESYGLIAIFALFQTWLMLLDLGLLPTLTRELARYRAGAISKLEALELLLSVERVYATVAVLASATVWLFAKWMVNHLPGVTPHSTSLTTQALSAGGCVLGLRWMVGLYRNSLVGLERQVWLNVYTSAFAAIRGAGVILVLMFISRTILAFFIYQGLCFALESFGLALYLRRLLADRSTAANFRWSSLRKIWRFAAGMTAITLLSILLTQIDKLALLRFLSLRDFGYYAIASSLASALGLMVAPVSNAIYPRLTLLAAENQRQLLIDTYHKSSQLLTLMLVPATVVLTLFSVTVLLLWTHDAIITRAAAPLVSVLAIGTMLNGLMHNPYNLQLAYGWTRFMIVVNSVSVVLIVPALYIGIRSHGAIAAATIWTLLNAGYIFIAVPIMHRKLLPTVMSKWYFQDTLLPAFSASAVALIIYRFSPTPTTDTQVKNALFLALALIGSFAAAAMSTQLGRNSLREFLRAAKTRL